MIPPESPPPSGPRFIRRLLRFFLRHEDGAGREAEFDELVSSVASDKSHKSTSRATWTSFLLSFPGLLKNFFYEISSLYSICVVILGIKVRKHPQ